TWAQINHPTGRVIQVTDPTSVGGTQSTYYCDDNSGSGECDGTDTTGDGVSYGETGFAFSGSVNNTSTITISLFVLPAADGENVGEIYQDYVNQPLQITVIPMGGFDNTVYLPILIK
nr:hypothetical protein [Gammaproteobacteria bacterium]NIW45450.1 hypothetical protein [Gammaproteobacteria bacterium]